MYVEIKNLRKEIKRVTVLDDINLRLEGDGIYDSGDKRLWENNAHARNMRSDNANGRTD